MLGPFTPLTDEDEGELLFHAARLGHPDVTIAGVLDQGGTLVAVEFTQHQRNAQVGGDARILDPREPVGSGTFDLNDSLAPLDITRPRS